MSGRLFSRKPSHMARPNRAAGSRGTTRSRCRLGLHGIDVGLCNTLGGRVAQAQGRRAALRKALRRAVCGGAQVQGSPLPWGKRRCLGSPQHRDQHASRCAQGLHAAQAAQRILGGPRARGPGLLSRLTALSCTQFPLSLPCTWPPVPSSKATWQAPSPCPLASAWLAPPAPLSRAGSSAPRAAPWPPRRPAPRRRLPRPPLSRRRRRRQSSSWLRRRRAPSPPWAPLLSATCSRHVGQKDCPAAAGLGSRMAPALLRTLTNSWLPWPSLLVDDG